MKFKEFSISQDNALALSEFKEMDYYAVENYQLPIELMMENAGLQLANLISLAAESIESKILIGIGNGNNGGGGLVAARRLSAWGYQVYLDVIVDIDKPLPRKQLERALAFGVSKETITKPDVWVDAYLGFSQRLPLRSAFLDVVFNANQLICKRVSLDIPTGFMGDASVPFFQAHQVMTLAAPKKILYNLPMDIEIFIADLGIPKEVYRKFGVEVPPFQGANILKTVR